MDRLTNGALRDLLDKLAPEVDGGAINLISVAAIRDRSEGKWGRRRTQVEDFIQRTFNRLSPPGGVLSPLNDIEFLAIYPGLSKGAALSLSAGIIKDTLQFFFGEVAPADFRLFLVSSIVDGELAIEPVNAASYLGGAEAGPARTLREGEDAAFAPVRGLAAPTTEVPATRRTRHRLSSSAMELDVEFSAEPIWNVRDKVVASFLVDPRLRLVGAAPDAPPPSPGDISPALAGEIALLALDYAVDRITTRREDGPPAAMQTPIPWGALSASNPRFNLLHTLRRLEPEVRRRVVLEITDIGEGLPQGRLAEAVSMLSPLCRAVLARAPSDAAPLLEWRRCGLGGITLDCAKLDAGDRRAQARLNLFARNATAAANACVGYGLTTQSTLVTAWAAGFTHLGGPCVRAGAPELMPMRLGAADFYKRVANPALAHAARQ